MRDEHVEEIEHAGLLVVIDRDDDAENPDQWGNKDLFLVANHRDFYVMPPGLKHGDTFPDAESLAEQYKKTHHIFGLEAYIHSGVVLALSREGNFPDRRWDVSQLGLVFAEKKSWRLRKSAEKAARGLIETWNQYLGGDVYGYTVKNADGSDIEGRDERGNCLFDSCWGFYGLESAISEGKASAEHIAETLKKQREAKIKTLIRNRVPLNKRTQLIDEKA